jgi:hypothetical protein
MYVRGYRWDSTGLGGFQFMYGFNWYLSCFSWFSIYVRGFHLFCKGLGIFNLCFRVSMDFVRVYTGNNHDVAIKKFPSQCK